MKDKKKSWLNESKALIIAALITAFSSAIIAYCFRQKSNVKIKDKTCISLRIKADSISTVIQKRIDKIKVNDYKDNRKRLNYLYWKEKLKEVSRYDCDKLNNNLDGVITSFTRAQNEMSKGNIF